MPASGGRTALLALSLVVAGAALYAGTLDGPFIYDDLSITADRDIRGFVPPWRVASASPGSAAAGRPVVHYSLALNHALGGLEVRGYHVFNLAVHLLCALALFGVVRRTLAGPVLTERYAGREDFLAWAAALIWLVHPLQTEAVDYVSQRSESIMGLFYLLTLYCAIRAIDSDQRRTMCVLAIVCCALGMASKEVMVSVPLVVPAYDRIFIGRPFSRLWRERRGLYLGLASTWLLLFGLMVSGPRSSTVGFSHEVGALGYAWNQCGIVLAYLRLALWPHPLVLDYGAPQPLGLSDVTGCLAVLSLLLAATVWLLRRHPALGFCAAWVFVVLAPTSSIVPIVTEVGAERRMYLPLAGIVVLAVAAGDTLVRAAAGRRGPGAARWLAVALLAATVVPLGWATVRRNHDYRSGEAIWRSAVASRPDNARAHSNLGKALQSVGRLDAAIESYERAAEIDPDLVEARSNLGAALLVAGKPDEAIAHLREALRVEPRYVSAHYNLGRVLQSQRRIPEAIEHYRAALATSPGDVAVHNSLGVALALIGRMDEAVVHFRRALEIDPHDAEARMNLERAARAGSP